MIVRSNVRFLTCSILLADLVIGKHSVIVAETKSHSLKLKPVAQLTDKEGQTDQHGLVVVRGTDPALIVDDLEGYRIISGPANCDEKSAAPKQLLLDAEIKLPDNLETADSCSLAAKGMLECPPDEKVAAIVSSYAAPLLEGCGTINKGDLRVVGKSEPVPFIMAFLRAGIDSANRDMILDSLWLVQQEPDLQQMLETRDGFKPFVATPDSAVQVEEGSDAGTETVTSRATDSKKNSLLEWVARPPP